MLIVMKTDATDHQVDAVVRIIEDLGYKAHSMPGATRTAIGITGNQGAVDPSHFENLPGVAEAIRVSKPYKLISLDLRPEKTVVRIGDAVIGGEELAIIAGPCAIESRAQAFAVAEAVRRSGARFFRGGAYKPRTSPYAFQGLGEEGLKILAEIRDTYGLKIVTEALDEAGVDRVERYGDMIQIGARNMQNFVLLRRVGSSSLRTRHQDFRPAHSEYSRPRRNSRSATTLSSARDRRSFTRNRQELYGYAARSCGSGSRSRRFDCRST